MKGSTPKSPPSRLQHSHTETKQDSHREAESSSSSANSFRTWTSRSKSLDHGTSSFPSASTSAVATPAERQEFQSILVNSFHQFHITEHGKSKEHPDNVDSAVTSAKEVAFDTEQLRPTLEALGLACSVALRVPACSDQCQCEAERVLEAVSPSLQLPVKKSHIPFKTRRCFCRIYGQKGLGKAIYRLPLTSVWNWYETPSCYGMPVKFPGDGDAREELTAYFVPYLSAIRFFGRDYYGKAKLLYQFSENEIPNSRLPLFLRIQDLVRQGNTGSGDPTVLQSHQIGNFHPTSWYSVAWYPIYKFPDGDFRAIFLTYHCLGHGHVSRDKSQLQLPALGLQTLYCPGEWFAGNKELLPERQSSLSNSALFMSRAPNSPTPNSHPFKHYDYEFCLSRQ